ncbi:hypothetical protein Pelo_9698 [Pelomyxa schiedti]|nr:hypothetical protein Pelo_9698 [Pelomyxa schiedti]
MKGPGARHPCTPLGGGYCEVTVPGQLTQITLGYMPLGCYCRVAEKDLSCITDCRLQSWMTYERALCHLHVREIMESKHIVLRQVSTVSLLQFLFLSG